MKIMCLLLIIACLVATGAAKVSVGCSYYNNQDSMSMSLDGSGFDFNSKTILKPDSLRYENGGGSTQPRCEYSYKLTLNDESLESGAKTDSGSFSWHAKADSNYDHPGSKVLKLSAKSTVIDGTLSTHCSNPEIKVERETKAERAAYQEISKVGSDSLESTGNGFTIDKENDVIDPLGDKDSFGDNVGSSAGEAASTAASKTKGLKQVTAVNGYNKLGKIDTDILGDTEFQWSCGVRSGKISGISQYTFGIMAEGYSRKSMDKLGMMGDATGFPTQFLPSGEVEFSETTESEIKAKELIEYMEDEYGKFIDDHPDQPSSALWYQLDQRCHVNTFEEPLGVNENLIAQKYYMSMAFGIKAPTYTPR